MKAAVTRRKMILSGKRKVIDGKHVVTVPEILSGLETAEEITKKRKTTGVKKSRGRVQNVVEASNEESEASQDESLVILDCIEVES